MGVFCVFFLMIRLPPRSTPTYTLFPDPTLCLSVLITAQRMFTAEPRRKRVLLERIVDRCLWLEEIFQRQPMGLHELPQGEGSDEMGDSTHEYLVSIR